MILVNTMHVVSAAEKSGYPAAKIEYFRNISAISDIFLGKCGKFNFSAPFFVLKVS